MNFFLKQIVFLSSSVLRKNFMRSGRMICLPGKMDHYVYILEKKISIVSIGKLNLGEKKYEDMLNVALKYLGQNRK